MYEKLTKYLSDFDMDKIGKWTSEKHEKGTKDDPLLFPGMINSIPVHRFADEVTEFVLDHPEEELNHYYDILEEKDSSGRRTRCAMRMWPNLMDVLLWHYLSEQSALRSTVMELY